MPPHISPHADLAWAGPWLWARSFSRARYTFKFGERPLALDTGIDRYANREKVQITAHVIQDGREQQGGFNEIRQTVDIETEMVETAAGVEALRSGVRLSIYSPHPAGNDSLGPG